MEIKFSILAMFNLKCLLNIKKMDISLRKLVLLT